MKTFITISTLICAFALTSCEDAITNEPADPDVFLEHVESVTVQPASFDTPGDYVSVSVRLAAEMLDLKKPDALFVLGTEDGVPLQPSENDPLHFTGTIQHPELAEKIDALSEEERSKGIEFGCKMEITSPGEISVECDGKECSETSLLGGKTWFCICIYECEWKITL